MSELRLESFTNQFGQTINVGDDVIYAGTSWKSTSFNRGKFGGVYIETRPRYDREPVRAITAVRIDGIPARRFKYDPATKTGSYVPYIRTATLPLKRVFRLDTPIEKFEGTGF